MKTTKFLIVVGDPGFIEDVMTDDQWERSYKADLPEIKVIECINPDWTDNLVKIGPPDYGYEMIRDKDGVLYYIFDICRREDLINWME